MECRKPAMVDVTRDRCLASQLCCAASHLAYHVPDRRIPLNFAEIRLICCKFLSSALGTTGSRLSQTRRRIDDARITLTPMGDLPLPARLAEASRDAHSRGATRLAGLRCAQVAVRVLARGCTRAYCTDRVGAAFLRYLLARAVSRSLAHTMCVDCTSRLQL